jgi:hypothetical protein
MWKKNIRLTYMDKAKIFLTYIELKNTSLAEAKTCKAL